MEFIASCVYLWDCEIFWEKEFILRNNGEFWESTNGTQPLFRFIDEEELIGASKVKKERKNKR